MTTGLALRQGARVLLAGLGLSAALMAAQYPPQTPVPPGPGSMRPYGGRAFGMRDGAARILPPGAWWKDQDLVQRLELTPDQQKRIDDLFVQNRMTLGHMHAGLDEEQLQLQPLLNANPVDDGRVLAEIGKIADMRADLEKATAKMLLQMRGVLTQAQWTKLQQERPSGMHEHMYMHGADGGPQRRMDSPVGDGGQGKP